MLALCRLRLAASTIANRCIHVASLRASRQLRHRCAEDGRHCAVPNYSCVSGNWRTRTEDCLGCAEGNGRRAGAQCDRLPLRLERRRAIGNARTTGEGSGRQGARPDANVYCCNMHDHRGPCGHPRRPPRAGAYRTGGQRRSITATLRQDGRIGSSSGLKTSHRPSARRCTAIVDSCRTAQIDGKLHERTLISP